MGFLPAMLTKLEGWGGHVKKKQEEDSKLLVPEDFEQLVKNDVCV